MKYAVIFGAASGLARASILELLDHGYTVFGFDINIDNFKEHKNLYLCKCDVLDNSSLRFALTFVLSKTEQIDVLSNFVGMVKIGSLVELDIDSLNKIFQLNVNSTYKINSLFFPLVKNGKGKIINISSEYGRITAIPWHGYYPITKYATEIYSDSLRRELAKSGVKVIKIRPGAFKTNMQGGVVSNFNEILENTKMYEKELMKLKFMMDGELKNAKDPKIFGKKFVKICESKHPRKVYNIKNSFKMKLLTVLPSWLQDLIFRSILK